MDDDNTPRFSPEDRIPDVPANDPIPPGELIDARLPAFEELDGDVAVPTKVEFDLDVRRGAVVVDSAAAE